MLWIFNIFQNILSKWGIIRFIILMCGTHEPVGCQWYDLYSLQIWSVRRPGFGPGLFKACKQGFVKCFQDLLERYENFTRWILELDTQWGKPTIWGWGVPPLPPIYGDFGDGSLLVIPHDMKNWCIARPGIGTGTFSWTVPKLATCCRFADSRNASDVFLKMGDLPPIYPQSTSIYVLYKWVDMGSHILGISEGRPSVPSSFLERPDIFFWPSPTTEKCFDLKIVGSFSPDFNGLLLLA